MRTLDYIASARQAISRQRGRTVLTITAMAISTTIVVSLAALSLGLASAAQSTLAPDASMSSVVITPTRSAATASLFGGAQEVAQNDVKLTDDTLATFAHAPHVASATPLAEIWEFKSFQVQGSAPNFVAQAAGTTPAIAQTHPLIAGNYFADSTAHQVVLGYGYARELGVTPNQLIGQQVVITTQNGYVGDGAAILSPTASAAQAQDYANHPTTLTAIITGVIKPGIDESRMFIPLTWARQVRMLRSLAYTPAGDVVEKRQDQIGHDGYSSILVQADSPASVPSVVALANQMGVGALSAAQQLQKLGQFTTVLWVGLGSIALVTLFAGALGIVNTMLSAVAEQRQHIGIWRAHGATRGLIARLYLLQAALLGLIAGLIGVLASVGIVQIADNQLQQLLQAQNLPVTSLATMSWQLAAAGVGLTITFAILAGVYPAWRAARQDVVRVLSGS